MSTHSNGREETITLGGGCFWCLEAVYDEMRGVTDVLSGYSGGHVANPSYREVCNETTGHAEVIQVTFNPDIISLQELLSVFFTIHDPTTLNRQGADIGTQYRSVIFYHDEAQRETAVSLIEELNNAHIWDNPIVTEVAPFATFYVAEAYHQNYYVNNPGQGYCRVVVAPKVAKFRQRFNHLQLMSAMPYKSTCPRCKSLGARDKDWMTVADGDGVRTYTETDHFILTLGASCAHGGRVASIHQDTLDLQAFGRYLGVCSTDKEYHNERQRRAHQDPGHHAHLFLGT